MQVLQNEHLPESGPRGATAAKVSIFREKATNRMRFSRETKASFAALTKLGRAGEVEALARYVGEQS
jgi:hypothetical protein